MACIFGVDSSVPLSLALFDLATRKLDGTTPAFWGRYFNGYHHTDAEYVPIETALFSGKNLKLLPLAQQTLKVHGTKADGAQHARVNVQKFIAAMGVEHLAESGGEFVMFLDIEGEEKGKNPSLSSDYYVGWSTALVSESRARSDGRFVILPGIYARTKDSTTWQALADAQAGGTEPCAAIWVTRQRTGACNRPLVSWNAKDASFLRPSGDLGSPVVCWQFAIDCPDGNGVDLDIVNPEPDTMKNFLDRLVTPAAP